MNVLPLPYLADSLNYFLRLQDLPNKVWLDSGSAQHQHGRYDIISAAPKHCVHAMHADELKDEINSSLQKHVTHSELPFCGGWIGYIHYEARHQKYGLPPYRNVEETQADQVFFGWYDWALIQDHQKQKSFLVFHAACSAAQQKTIQSLLVHPAVHSDNDLTFRCSQFLARQNKSDYLNAVERIHEHILNGDCYQTNYTQQFTAEFSGSSLGAYTALRATVPSPFAAYFERSDDETILSISPERFIQLKQRKALTQPIKGTASRSANSKRDQTIQTTLRNSKKNRAENVMIVDLLRNDFNQNCEFFSVNVPQVCELQSFANVHHLVSTVEGTLRDKVSHYQFILDCFPGGSITGAPKKSAMHIIDQLEPHKRGIYCGSIGYMSTNGNSDFNIAIRTLYRDKKAIHCWGGGGIVFDSKPESEFEESLQKVRALMTALETSQNRS